MFALCLSGMAAMAQSTRTIKGAVVDKDGNPLPGATVEATNGAESTVVDADGTFTLEVPRWLNTATAKYAGMKNKKMKVQDGDMIFRMNKFDSQWYVSVIGAKAGGQHLSAYGVGIMGGRLGNWGYYLKGMWVLNDNYSYDTAFPTITVGASKRIRNFMHAYAGVGYAKVNIEQKYIWPSGGDTYGGDTYGVDYNNDGVALEAGLLFTPVKRIIANVGITLNTDLDNHFNNLLHIGIGYVF